MIVLALRTDTPEAKMAIFDGDKRLGHAKWQAHRQLANTIHEKIKRILDESSITLVDVQGIVVFKGPGSFTGLRIGVSVANALAYSQNIPVVARGGEKWLEQGIEDLSAGKNDKIALPKYSTPATTTQPKK
jgi:tRNA threonylcarbamoyladenosine biosynthesis protein TsaB